MLNIYTLQLEFNYHTQIFAGATNLFFPCTNISNIESIVHIDLIKSFCSLIINLKSFAK